MHEILQENKLEGALFLVIRLILGAVFVYASVDKIIHPAAFAEVINKYQILPGELINLTAIVLPWLELLLGLGLIAGLWLPGASFLITVLMAIFCGALLFNIVRGLDINCGCFRTDDMPNSGAPMVWYVIRDGVFLLMSLSLFFRAFLKNRGSYSGG